VLVVDASVLATALIDDGRDGDRARGRLRGEALVAPAVVDLEVLSAFRQQLARGAVDQRRIELALDDLEAFRLRRVPHLPLLRRCWAHRENLTPYDTAYVALAELLGATLLTADARLAKAPGVACAVEVLMS
jgi:predicted nucleic acid-binding protein